MILPKIEIVHEQKSVSKEHFTQTHIWLNDRAIQELELRRITTDKEVTLDISGGFFGNLPPYFFLIESSCTNIFTANDITT